MAATYAELLIEVADELNRQDLTGAQLARFVSRAEARFNRTIWTPQSESVATLTAANPMTLPSDFRAVRHVYLSTDPKTPLEQVTPSYLHTAYGDATTGKPVVYALIGDQMRFGPAAGSYNVVLDYYAKIPSLQANSVNWLLSSHPDLYVYATCLYAGGFVEESDDKMARWAAAYDAALEELNEAGNKRRWGGGPLIRKGTAFS